MGLFDLFLKNRPKPRGEFQGKFEMLNGYEPRFTTWNGGIYESELIRSAINARAVHISKLKFESNGSAKPSLQGKLKKGPNQFQTWSQFLYRTSTVLDVHNTAFIIPIYDKYGEISGIFCPLPANVEIIQYGDKPYLRYDFRWGERAAIELEYCGILTKFQYRNDILGENNSALFPTLDLIHMQNQGIQEAVKSSATYRFYAQVNNFSKSEDLAKERKRFSEENFGKEAQGGGLLLFPNTYSNINQVKSQPYTIESEEMKLIEKNVYQYFMVNEDVLQNKAYGDAWSAFYEGAIEPFAVQFSEVLTKMLFTFREQSQGNEIMLTANRLQYMTNKDKLNVSSQLLDRGIMSINDIRDIWNLPPVEGGEARIIRGEYWNADEKINEERINDEGES
ncbi:MAG: phage portal protein [Clostridiales bacterium]|nr:phage portal protein [Clostridiales bacterium]MBQ1570084.1 phage portal protein [Clostridiales bacterium]